MQPSCNSQHRRSPQGSLLNQTANRLDSEGLCVLWGCLVIGEGLSNHVDFTLTGSEKVEDIRDYNIHFLSFPGELALKCY